MIVLQLKLLIIYVQFQILQLDIKIEVKFCKHKVS